MVESSTMRVILGTALLLFQMSMIVYARFVPSRYFCWAPMDSQNLYEIQTSINGRNLSPDEILSRYRQPSKGGNWQAIQHVLDKIKQYEETYGRNDKALVSVTYSVNGHPKQQWYWPQE